MTADRFYVVTVTGWTVSPRAAGSGGRDATSLSVLDSVYNHREVYKRYAYSGGRYLSLSREAHAVAAELNARDRRAA